MNRPSIVAPHPPIGTRPDWVRPAGRPVRFWLPVATVLGMTLLLILCWPGHRHGEARSNNLPEATASYVRLEGSYSALPSDPLRNRWLDSGSSSLPERDDTLPARHLPSPEYSGLTSLLPWAPAQPAFPSNTPPNLAHRPVTDVLTGLAPANGGMSLSLAPGLQRADFHFDLPADLPTNRTVDARFYIELDDSGRVVHLLAEPSDNPAAVRLLESAISQGRGARVGSGQIQVSWGR